jgi:Helix-turn-helix domain
MTEYGTVPDNTQDTSHEEGAISREKSATSWAWEQVAPSAHAKLVLLCIALYAGREGASAYPSVAVIRARTGLSEKAVAKAINQLFHSGLIDWGVRP